MHNNNHLGLKIAELRKNRNLTQAQLAKELGKSTSTIAMWETGQRDPDSSMILKLAERFNVTSDYLLGTTIFVTPIEDTPKSIKAWLRSDQDLLPEEKEKLSGELEDYFKARKERIMKERHKGE